MGFHDHVPAALRIVPCRSCLVTMLAEVLATYQLGDLEKTVLVMPTERMATFLLAAMARTKTAFYPPKVMTLERFVEAHNPGAASKIFPDIAIDLLLAGLIKRTSYTHLGPGHERELRLLFSELSDADLGGEVFDELLVKLHDDIHLSDIHIQSLEKRIAEIKMLHKEFLAALQRLNGQSQAMALQRGGKALLESWRLMHRMPYHRVIFAGFTSMAKSLRPFLRRLLAMDNVEFWLSESPALYSDINPLLELEMELGGRARTSGPDLQAKLKRSVTVVNARSRFSETATVLLRCQDFIEKGVAPARIGILVTSETEYGPILRTLVQELGISANIALTASLDKTTGGLWLKALVDATLSGEDVFCLLTWLINPISQRWLCRELQQEEVTPSILTAICIAETSKLGVGQGIDSLIKATHNRSFKAALNLVRDLWSILGVIDKKPRVLADWLEVLQQLLVNFRPFASPETGSGVAESASQVVAEFFGALGGIAALLDSPIAAREFWQLVRECFLNLEVRAIGEPLAGIQILSLAEARYIPFDVVMILGCNEGSFPKALPKDDLMDDYLKREIGLAGWQRLEAMEDLTFSLLRERLPVVELYRPTHLFSEPLVRSRFIEKLVGEGNAEIYSVDRDALVKWQHDKLSVKETPVTYACEGKIDFSAGELLATMSASSVESLIQCPYRFLLSKLAVRDLSIPTALQDPKEEGNWLHGVLEAFFTGMVNGRRLEAPGLGASAEFASSAKERLLALTRQLAPSGFLHTPLYYHLKRQAWPRFVQHLEQIFGEQNLHLLANGLKEVRLDKAQLTIRGRQRRVSGRIDSVDVLSDFHLVTDYKRRSMPSAKEVISGVSPQLAFYALALHSILPHLSQDRVILGYWNIIDGQWEVRAMGSKLDHEMLPGCLVTAKTGKTKEIIQAMLELWSWREEEISAAEGHFFADVSRCGLCNYEGICRKSDLLVAGRLKEKKSLKGYLEKRADHE